MLRKMQFPSTISLSLALSRKRERGFTFRVTN